MTDPVLSDGVITLRPWSRGDADLLRAAATDPAIQRFSGPLPSQDRLEARWRAFEPQADPTGLAFAICDHASDARGMCGVDSWSETAVAQFGYWLVAEARGQGRATRAARLVTTWLFELGATRVVLKVRPGNDASAAVARRAGFTHEETLHAQVDRRGRPTDVDGFIALASDWPTA